ncbi:hypothetical protein QCA50_009696 [Cerrena zonata]|uniref:Uncharacterized protein n=1 Tax=Cerrena zonata TaxID=2478898 RepID=A0AAW0GBB0_9APHY
MHALTAFYALVLAQTYIVQGHPIQSSGLRSRATTSDALSNGSTLSKATSDPASMVDTVTCDVFGVKITDPQQAINQVQSKALQPPSSCDCTAEQFIALIEKQCSAPGSRHQSKIASRPNGGPQGSTGSGVSAQPNTYQPFQSVPNSNPGDNASRPPPPPTNGDNNGPGSGSSSDSNNSAIGSTHEDAVSNDHPASPPSAAPAPASQQTSEQPSVDPTEQKDATPTKSDNVNDDNTTASSAAVNSDPPVPANDTPKSEAKSDSGLTFNPQEDDSNKSNNDQTGSASGSINSDGSGQDTDPAPNTASPNGNGYASYGQPDTASSEPSANRINHSQKSVRPSQSGACNGLACVVQDIGAPILPGASTKSLTSGGLGNGLVSGMKGCPSGDISLCLDAATGQ